jgi:cbb3-type cytochrome oxidase subunit 3
MFIGFLHIVFLLHLILVLVLVLAHAFGVD